eukprot:scaffold78744_cov23-Cyclotella_meneghiniana.AAC.2
MATWFDVEKVEDAVIPGTFSKQLNDLDKKMLMRAIRPDRLLNSLITNVGNAMGQEYVTKKWPRMHCSCELFMTCEDEVLGKSFIPCTRCVFL